MAVEATGSGFFSSNGVLLTEPVSSTASKPADNTAAAAPAGKAADAEDVAAQIRTATAAQITEAAVVSITAKMNVGGTGFDEGVADMVKEAVTMALSKRTGTTQIKEMEDGADQTARRPIGGTYQNQIIAGATKVPEEAEPVIPEPPKDEQPIPPGKAKPKMKGGSYQNELIKNAKADQGALNANPAALGVKNPNSGQ